MRLSFKTLLALSALAALPALAARGQTLQTLVGLCSAPGYYGDGGPASLAGLDCPDDIAFDSRGNYYIADACSNTVREVNIATGIITTYAGLYNPNGNPGTGDGGPATLATLNYPSGIAFDDAGNLYIADYYDAVIRKVSAASGIITTYAGNWTAGYSGDGGPALSAQLGVPDIVRLDPTGQYLYLSDQGNSTVRRISLATGIITTVAGDGTAGYTGDGGPATSAELNQPEAMGFDAAGDLYIGDTQNSVIREVNAATGNITTVAGSGADGFSGDGGPATQASLGDDIGSVTFTCNGNMLFTDDMNNRVRMVDKATGTITTVMGTGNPGCSTSGTGVLTTDLSHPEALVYDHSGNLYLVDYDYNLVQEIQGGLCPATPTSTSTATARPTSTPTPTLTPSPTKTPPSTATSSFTPTSTPTSTPTPTPSSTPTSTFSPTSTPMVTATFSATLQVQGSYSVRVAVYNEAGELIKTLQVYQMSQAVNSLTLEGSTLTRLSGAGSQVLLYCQGSPLGMWDGTDSSGNPVSNGVYHIQATSVDPEGVATTVTQEAVVSRSLSQVTAAVYNEAGEIVRHLTAWVDDASSAAMTNVSLSADVLNPGSSAKGAANSLQILIQASGTAVTLTWDGTSDQGGYVTSGHYLISVHWESGQGGGSDISKSVLVSAGSGREGGEVFAQPNLLRSAQGQNRVWFVAPPGQEMVLRVKIYTVAGELAASFRGDTRAGQISWDASGLASGLYLAVVEKLSPEGGLMGRQVLKITFLR